MLVSENLNHLTEGGGPESAQTMLNSQEEYRKYLTETYHPIKQAFRKATEENKDIDIFNPDELKAAVSRCNDSFHLLDTLTSNKNFLNMLDGLPIDDALGYLDDFDVLIKNGEYGLLTHAWESLSEITLLESYKRQARNRMEEREAQHIKSKPNESLKSFNMRTGMIREKFKEKNEFDKYLKGIEQESVLFIRGAFPDEIFNQAPLRKYEKPIYYANQHFPLISSTSLHDIFSDDYLVTCSAYTDAESFSLYGVGMIYKPHRITGVFPTDVASDGYYGMENPNVQSIIDPHDLKKLSSSRLNLRLNPVFPYPEIWLMGEPEKIFVRPYYSLVSKSVAQGWVQDTGRALAAWQLSRFYNKGIRILK